VLRRTGHTEAAVDLAVLAGRRPAGVLCEILMDDGRMARVPDLVTFCEQHDLLLISIADLVRYRLRTDRLVHRVATTSMPTEWGEFTAIAYDSSIDDETHLALVVGDPAAASARGEEVLVRVHSECLTGDVLGSRRCDCGPQLHEAMMRVHEAGCGVIVYLRGQEGRGIGLGHKLRAYELQEGGFDTVDANLELGLPVDSREYGTGAQILVDLGIERVRLITNNPAKYSGLGGFGLQITSREPIVIPPNPHNEAYLRTKRERLGHFPEEQLQ
jgi:3,4-dihydroxy 2-butanone 4-phosphate synthase/GTP cyclohydrolase II